jgi:hypothetical protein
MGETASGTTRSSPAWAEWPPSSTADGGTGAYGAFLTSGRARSARGKPVAHLQALGQPQVLQLAHIRLERLRLPAQRRREVGSTHGRRCDQAQDGLGPGRGGWPVGCAGADARQLVVGDLGLPQRQPGRRLRVEGDAVRVPSGGGPARPGRPVAVAGPSASPSVMSLTSTHRRRRWPAPAGGLRPPTLTSAAASAGIRRPIRPPARTRTAAEQHAAR